MLDIVQTEASAAAQKRFDATVVGMTVGPEVAAAGIRMNGGLPMASAQDIRPNSRGQGIGDA